MKSTVFFILFSIAMVSQVNSQTPVRDLIITITDDVGGKQELRFGLAASATNGLDRDLGENELPPFPPTGVFEARFIGNDIGVSELGLGSYQDYRTGDSGFEGTITHELKYQVGASGSQIEISWDFPEGVTAIMEDFVGGVVVNETMSDSGGVVLTNLAVDKLKMTVTYAKMATSVENLDTPTTVDFQLFQNYPNPFNPTTQITYLLSKDTRVRVSVYNLLGQEVARLVDQFQKAGRHSVMFRPNDLSSGVYLYKIQAGAFSASRKLTLIQ